MTLNDQGNGPEQAQLAKANQETDFQRQIVILAERHPSVMQEFAEVVLFRRPLDREVRRL